MKPPQSGITQIVILQNITEFKESVEYWSSYAELHNLQSNINLNVFL